MLCLFRAIFLICIVGQGCLLIYDAKISSEFEANATNLQKIQYFGIATNFLKQYTNLQHLKYLFVLIHALSVVLIFKKQCFIWTLNFLAFAYYIATSIFDQILKKKVIDSSPFIHYLIFMTGMLMICSTYQNSCCGCCAKNKGKKNN